MEITIGTNIKYDQGKVGDMLFELPYVSQLPFRQPIDTGKLRSSYQVSVEKAIFKEREV